MDQVLLLAIRNLDSKLDSVLQRLDAVESSEWVDSQDVMTMLGISERHLRQLVAEGTIHGDAIRNVGTVKRTRYKFHRKLVMNQYLSRA